MYQQLGKFDLSVDTPFVGTLFSIWSCSIAEKDKSVHKDPGLQSVYGVPQICLSDTGKAASRESQQVCLKDLFAADC